MTMKIGIDFRLYHYQKAGISLYAQRLAQGLSEVDHENDYILFQHSKDKEPLVQADNFRRRTLHTPPHHRLEQKLLSREMRLHHVDILHSPDFIPPFGACCSKVITVHDLAFIRYPYLLTKEAARYYAQVDRAAHHADSVIAVSRSTKNDLVKLLGIPESKISVIYEAAAPYYRPIDREEAYRWLQKRYRLPQDFILFVSTIEPRKNLLTLLHAYHRFREKYHGRQALVLAGAPGWHYEEIYQEVAKLNIGSHCLFLNRVSNEELLRLYNAALMLVHPAFYEGFGLTPLEAMACGAPAIVSNASSLPEVVGDAALLVSPTDEEGWTVNINHLANDEELRHDLREKGLKRAKLFSWQKAARETLEVYRRVYNAKQL